MGILRIWVLSFPILIHPLIYTLFWSFQWTSSAYWVSSFHVSEINFHPISILENICLAVIGAYEFQHSYDEMFGIMENVSAYVREEILHMEAPLGIRKSADKREMRGCLYPELVHEKGMREVIDNVYNQLPRKEGWM